VEPEDILAGRYKDLTKDIMVTTATDGNHGRSVAWGARLLGCPCRIYIHKQVSQGRKKAMEALGAEVIQIDGTYDDSVNFATQEAEEFGWNIISDTSYEGYMEIPRYILAGYTVMVEEIFSQLDGNDLPTHIFLQGGVGGLASAIAAYAWEKFGANCPRIVVVEPSKAPCLMASAISGQPTTVTITEETMMAGLSCGKASLLSWAILEQATDDFVTIPDTHVAEMMRTLSKGVDGDPKIVAGESAVAGLAALDMARAKPETFAALDLDADSHVLIIGTEGATDPEIYNRIISE
jgi:diaminopropionate ammonia-lyase